MANFPSPVEGLSTLPFNGSSLRLHPSHFLVGVFGVFCSLKKGAFSFVFAKFLVFFFF